MSEDKTQKVTGFMDWIARDGGLESVSPEPAPSEIPRPPWATDEEVEAAAEGVRRLGTGEPLEPPHVNGLEAIIIPQERPVVDVVNDSFGDVPAPFEGFGIGDIRTRIEAAIPSIGRIEIPGHPWRPYAGTGFVVGRNLLMTNRHVAELFAFGIGLEGLSFNPGQPAAIDFKREKGSTDDDARLFDVTRIVMVHPYWDMALVATDGLGGIAPLRLAVDEPAALQDRDVAVIGYPALDPSGHIDLQNRIFRSLFNVKRMQPGRLRARGDIKSFGKLVSAVTHDSSTLGGNSGSAVIDATTGMVVALHFAGFYLKANYAVPTHELALDRRVVEAGVNFASGLPDPGSLPSDDYWRDADPPGEAPAAAAAAPAGAAVQAPRVPDRALSWSIPLEVTVQIRGAGGVAATGGTAGLADAGIEALREPFRDEDFSTRQGYDEQFLGIAVPVPRILDETAVSHLDGGSPLLPYEHFSVVQHKLRRLALFTAANVDASPARKAPEPDRDYSRKGLTGLGENDQEKWFTDPRIPAIHQLPDRFFTKDRTAFDKGHIVRREDVAWGDSYDEVRRANGDTFHVTNCSPQVKGFNRSNLDGLWGELENLVLAQAATERYCLFAGPVLHDEDPFFAGVDDEGTVRVQIPRKFWKIVVASKGDELQTFAFLLEQDLTRTPLEFVVDAVWRSRMVAVPKLQELTRLLELPPELHASDQFVG